jgi:uncharacterized membrane protein
LRRPRGITHILSCVPALADAMITRMLDAVHIHLMITHLPVVGCLGALALYLAAAWWRERTLYLAATVALLCSALATVPAYFSGVLAAGSALRLDPATQAIMDTHGMLGQFALLLMLLAGAWAVVALVRDWRGARLPVRPASLAAAAVLLALFVYLGYVANTGGQVRHTEIRPTAQHQR